MFKISKSELVFFDLFEEAADMAVECSKALIDLITDYTDVPQKVKAIEEIEHNCDLHVHKIIELLNKSFITPIDREDIFLIAKEMDDVVDAIEAIAHRCVMYNVQEIRSDVLPLVRLVELSMRELKGLMHLLRTIKKSEPIMEKVIEINRLENEGDRLYRSAMNALFTTETDAVEVIKWKGIYELIEKSLDACEDVANIVEGVVMKHA